MYQFVKRVPASLAIITEHSHSSAQSYLQDPGAIAGESVPGVDDVSVPGETAQQVPYALDEGVDLRMDQDLRDEILARILDQPFACGGGWRGREKK